MPDDQDVVWYHGSPLKLAMLREGSTITMWRDLARVFSHKPPIVCITDEETLQHNGNRPGYLYRIDEVVGPEDVIPHPRTTMRPGDEWLTTRELRLRLLGETEVRAEEFLTETDIAALLQRLDDIAG